FPYSMAIMKEAFRFWTLEPLAVPHFLQAEDEYKGYKLPAGSIILPNIWAIHHSNEDLYPDPFVFNPDHFLDDR
ncbi:cytochrome P450, partial [Flammula alnicola]